MLAALAAQTGWREWQSFEDDLLQFLLIVGIGANHTAILPPLIVTLLTMQPPLAVLVTRRRQAARLAR